MPPSSDKREDWECDSGSNSNIKCCEMNCKMTELDFSAGISWLAELPLSSNFCTYWREWTRILNSTMAA